MLSTSSNQETFIDCLHSTSTDPVPYDHWILGNRLDQDVVDELLNLPFDVPEVDCSVGKREAYNSTRRFFNPAVCEKFKACKTVAKTMQVGKQFLLFRASAG